MSARPWPSDRACRGRTPLFTRPRAETRRIPLTELTLGSNVQYSCAAGRNRQVRRLTTILVSWLSLVGVAMPVLACSLGGTGAGCCPAQTQPPCGTSEAQWSATVTVCCSAGPQSTSAVAVKPNRDVQSFFGSDTATLTIVGNWTPGSASARAVAPSSIPARRADAALTYLHTGRLRL
jgi:hypothetical protein